MSVGIFDTPNFQFTMNQAPHCCRVGDGRVRAQITVGRAGCGTLEASVRQSAAAGTFWCSSLSLVSCMSCSDMCTLDAHTGGGSGYTWPEVERL